MIWVQGYCVCQILKLVARKRALLHEVTSNTLLGLGVRGWEMIWVLGYSVCQSLNLVARKRALLHETTSNSI